MRRILAVLMAAGLVLGIAGSANANEIIKAKNGNRFVPKRAFAGEGEKVIWKNVSNVNHTVTAVGGGWNKDVTLSPGEKTKKTFRKEGTYRYKCTIHEDMRGRVIVEA